MDNMDFSKLYTDRDMRKKLLENPREIFEEANIDLMSSVDFKVVVNTKETFYFVMPAGSKSGELDLTNINVAASTFGSVGSIGSAATLSSIGVCLGSASSASTVGTAGSLS